MQKKSKAFITVMFAFVLLLLGGTPQALAHSKIPNDYGAEGALADNNITLEEALTYAIEDEYLAQARYQAIIEKYGQIKPFTQIQFAEKQHIAALMRLFRNYNLKVPKDNAAQYVSTPDTLKAAYEAGVKGEVDNIAMYEKLTSLKDLPNDVKIIMDRLRDASKNHLAAFKRQLR